MSRAVGYDVAETWPVCFNGTIVLVISFANALALGCMTDL